jgi:hypothetical protein
MKRTLTFVVLFLTATSAFAFDTDRERVKVGVLRIAHDFRGADNAVAERVLDNLRSELRKRGFDAFDAQMTYEQLEQETVRNADYYVEILAPTNDSQSRGGVGVGGPYAGVSVEMLVARVAAEMQLYDGDTLETIAAEPLGAKTRGLMPTTLDIGVGGRSVWALIAVPLMRNAEYRMAAQAVARQAAEVVANVLVDR